MRKLKLIWDFKGPDAERTAAHHLIHLDEYVKNEKVTSIATGVEKLNENHHIAFLALEEIYMPAVRDALKPHRGQLWND
jgi:exosome complex RNA-binding protein Rrp4